METWVTTLVLALHPHPFPGIGPCKDPRVGSP